MGHARGVLCLGERAGRRRRAYARPRARQARTGRFGQRTQGAGRRDGDAAARLRRAPETARRVRRARAGARISQHRRATASRCSLESQGSLVERTARSRGHRSGRARIRNLLPPCIAEKVPATPGERVTLEIYAVVNLDGNSGRFTYYGFTNAIEREFFEALITVASIGPRSAARAFSRADVDDRRRDRPRRLRVF